MFLSSYKEYLQFVAFYKLNTGNIQQPNFDFPDFPRTDFYNFLIKVSKFHLPEDYLKKFKDLNPKSNVFSLKKRLF